MQAGRPGLLPADTPGETQSLCITRTRAPRAARLAEYTQADTNTVFSVYDVVSHAY